MKLNRIVLIISVIVISIWMLQLYRNRCLNVEYYSGVAQSLEEHINDSEKKLNSLYVMNAFVHLTEDDNIIQEAYNSAELNDRQTLTILLEKVKKKNPQVKNE